MSALPEPAGEGPDGANGAPPFWEWVVAGLGLVLLLACVGYLTVHALRGPVAPPHPVVELVDVQAQGGRFLAQVRISNRSGGTAEALRIVGELRQGGQVVERSEVELAFLPGESTREAGLFFVADPRLAELRLAPLSYRKP